MTHFTHNNTAKFKQKTSQQGYSSVELMIVVAIIATLAVTVNFSYSPANSKLKSAARELYAHMQNARMEAIKRNTDYGIIFNKATNSYAICAYSAGSCVGDNTTIDLTSYGSGVQFGFGNAEKNATAAGGACPASCGDAISYSPDSVYFDFKGLSRKQGYIYLENDKNSSLTIATPYLTGSVIMRQWNGTAWE